MLRDKTIDIAKGLCLLLMVIGHCYGLPSIVWRGIESFHMPFFFIAGGFFFKQKPLSQVCLSGVKRLIVPLLIGTAICAIICLCFGHEHGAWNYIKALLYPGGTRPKDILAPSWPCLGVFWFLAALFWTRLIYAGLYEVCRKHILWICAGLSWAFIILARRLMLPFGFTEGMSGLVFYAVGQSYAAYVHNQTTPAKIPRYAYALFLVAWIVDINLVVFQMFQCNYVWYLYPLGVCFACGMGKVVYDFADVLKDSKAQYLSLVGMYGLEIMCCHQVIRTIVGNMRAIHDISMENYMMNSILIVGTLFLSSIYIILKKTIRDRIR